MFRILIRKFLEVFVFLLFIMFVSFLFIRLAPGDPVLTILNVEELSVSKEQVEAPREEMGFNDSLPVQFGRWSRLILYGWTLVYPIQQVSR